MKFTYPRELSFVHPDYQVGCAETETPFIGANGKTFLYVWNKVAKHYAYYCFEDDLFWSPKDYELTDVTSTGGVVFGFSGQPVEDPPWK